MDDHVRKSRHTKFLRQAYARSANRSRTLNREWERLDDESWSLLDKLSETQKTDGRYMAGTWFEKRD